MTKTTQTTTPRRHGKSIAAAVAVAAAYRDIKREESQQIDTGVVVVFNGTACGWVNKLRDPQTWEPGCIAVEADGNCHIATGGNAYDGATSWEPVNAPTTANKTTLNTLLANADKADQLASYFKRTGAGDVIAPPPGTLWEEQGGWYAGVMRNPDNNQCWHLILPDAPNLEFPWGKYGQRIPGEFSHNDGLANTNLILQADPNNAAALHCAGFNAAGNIDCYWPADAELNLYRANLRDKCSNDWHWSSTQTSATNAWVQSGEYGDFAALDKTQSCIVRPVRRVMIGGAA